MVDFKIGDKVRITIGAHEGPVMKQYNGHIGVIFKIYKNEHSPPDYPYNVKFDKPPTGEGGSTTESFSYLELKHTKTVFDEDGNIW